MIEIKSQSEWDALPERFDVYTEISISGNITICKTPGNSHVVAGGNSHVEAWGNSHVVAGDSSHVEAWDEVSVHVHSDASTVLLFAFAVAILISGAGTVEKKSETATIIKPQIKPGLDGWMENNAVGDSDKVILYKRVGADFKTQENTDYETTWTIGTTLVHPHWDPTSAECGGGKFHACSRPYLCDEFRSTSGDRYIALRIPKSELYAWPNPQYPHKIAFRSGTVLCECDRYGVKMDGNVAG